MSARDGDTQMVFSMDGQTFASVGYERPIRTPARELCVGPEDLPPRWRERRVSVMEQPKFGQRDYIARRFAVVEGGVEKANLSFEVVVYKDHHTASSVFAGTLSKMGFLHLTKLDLGDMGAMIEVPGQPSRDLRALLFTERNVMGLIMLSTAKDYHVSNSWLISMGRLMVSRAR